MESTLFDAKTPSNLRVPRRSPRSHRGGEIDLTARRQRAPARQASTPSFAKHEAMPLTIPPSNTATFSRMRAFTSLDAASRRTASADHAKFAARAPLSSVAQVLASRCVFALLGDRRRTVPALN
jgi:hypothetical protein